jgi:hypothetical protein
VNVAQQFCRFGTADQAFEGRLSSEGLSADAWADRSARSLPCLHVAACCDAACRLQKWGRSSPTWCFARVQIDRRAMRNLVFFGHLLDRQGDREGDAYGDLCLSCTLHLPALQVAIEVL